MSVETSVTNSEELQSFVTPNADTFVTVAEAARALNLSERQVRRYAGRMAESDRLPAQNVRPGPDTMTGPSPARVRLSALALLARKVMSEAEALDKASSVSSEVTGSSPAQAGHDDRLPSESVRPLPGVVSENMAAIRAELEIEKRRAAVAEVERDGLKERLADTQAERDRLSRNLDEALAIARAAQDQERAGRLLGSGRTVQQIEASGLTGGDSSGDSGMGVGIVPPDSGTRPWWAFWKARG